MAIDAGTISAQVRVALDKLKGDVASVDAEINKIGSKAEQTASGTEKSFSDSFGAMSLAGVAAFAAITMAMKEAISVSGEYEQSIANVQSVVMGARDVFLQLDEAAKFAGQSTRFTASQAADALYDLASGGLDATESVGALNGVLMLAGASQSNLSSTAAVVVATLNQYNLKAEESSRISNVFSAAIANSMATMEKLTASMRMAGPVASALGISLEETVGSLEALYDAGFQGEQAGTALRAIMSALAAETDPTTQKLMALGLTFEQLNPAANSFADVIGNIAEVGATAGDIMSAFGTRAGAQMLTLLSAGKKGLEDYTKAITGTDTAARMYAIQNNTLKGSLDRLKSAAESAQIEFVEEFTPAMRGALEIVTKMLVAVSELPGPLKVFFAILLTGTPIVLGLAKAFTLLSLAINSMTGGIGIMVTAFVAGVAGIAGFASAINDANIKSTEKEFGDLAKEVGLTATEMKRLSDVAKELGLDPTKLKTMADDMGLTTEAVEKLNEVFNRFPLENRSVFEAIDGWSESLDITKDTIMKFLLTKEKLSASDRAIIESTLAASKAERDRLASINASVEGMKAMAEAESKAKAKKEKGMKDAQRLATEATDAYNNNLVEIDRRVKLGVTTELEANKEKKKAIDTYIESMLALNQKYIDIEGHVKIAVAVGEEFNAAIEEGTAADKAAADAIADKAAANEQAITTMKTYAERAEDVGKTEKQLLELSRKREIAIIAESKADDQAKKAAIDAINAYYKALNNQAAIDKKIADDKVIKDGTDAQAKATEDYDQKLVALTQTTKEAMEAERQRAIVSVRLMGGTQDEIDATIDALNKYYDALEETTAEDAAIAKTKKMAQDIKGIWDDLSGSLASLFSAIYDDKLDALESQLKAELEAAGLQEKSAAELAEAELTEARKQSAEEIALIQKRLDAATEAGDEQAALLLQQQINEANAKSAEVEREKQAAIDKAKIEEDYEKRRAKIQFDAAMVSWKIQMAQAVADAAMLALNGFLTKPFIPAGLIAGGVATAQGALQVAAVTMAKPKLATGGIVLPRAGGRDVTLAENGYAEMALNAGPSGQEMMGMFAQQIVDKMRGGNAKQSLTINVQVDRKTLSTLVVDDINNGRVRLER